MSNHTPGPWVWANPYDTEYKLVHFNGEKFPNGEPRYIKIIDDGSAGGEYSPSIDVHGPDALLIAAAPDMLEALKSVHDRLMFFRDEIGGKFNGELENIRKVIAKAEVKQ
jgi:hypothetical protein